MTPIHRCSFSVLCGLGLLLAASTLPAQSTKWKFVSVGDSRGDGVPINTAILTELAEQIVTQNAAFVIFPGDLVSAGSLSAFQQWQQIMAPVYNAGIGVYPVIGNHDATDVNAFIQVFGPDIPDNGPAGEINRTYSITHENVLVLGLDTYVNVGRVNQGWVNSTLSASTATHIFAFGHMPAFKANHTDCLDDYPTQRDAFWNSLRTEGAAAYFCGHDHFYDHMRVDDGDGNPNNDVHQLITGAGGAPFHNSYSYDGNNTTWTPRNLAHEQQYGYSVVEIDGNTATLTYWHRTGARTYAPSGDGWSYTVNTGPTPPPAPPTGLTATAGDGNVSLQWNASTGAETYNVKRATSPSGPYSVIAAGLPTTSHTDSGLVNGTTYYYVVSAVNAAGESSNSSYTGATPQPPPPGPEAPANLTATTGSRPGQITLTWSASTGATSYLVRRATTAGGPYTTVKTVTRTTFKDSKLVSGSRYYYVVIARNASGQQSPPSTEASAVAR